jgi:aminoglycoside phosphotransferase (APT) family kinase protein
VSPDPALVHSALDLAALTRHLERGGFPLCGPLSAELITTGRSNLTYHLSDERSRWILRRPPLGHVLAAVIAQTIVARHLQGVAVGERLSEVAGAVGELVSAGLRVAQEAQLRA